MQRFTIVSIVLTFVLAVVLAEIIVYEYSKNPEQLQTNTMNAVESEVSSNNKSEKKAKNTLDNNKGNDVKISTLSKSLQASLIQEPLKDVSKISTSLIRSAGLKNSRAKKVVFNRKLVDIIFLPERYHVLQKNIITGNVVEGKTYQIKLDDVIESQEFYEKLKMGFKNADNSLKINETNRFGNNSFYVNTPDRGQSVILIVRVRDRIYAFSYSSSIHENINQVIDSL